MKEQLEGGCNYTPVIPEFWRLRQKGGELGAELHSNTLLKKEEKKARTPLKAPKQNKNTSGQVKETKEKPHTNKPSLEPSLDSILALGISLHSCESHVSAA